MVRFLVPLLLITGCKPTCPPKDLECLVASLVVHDVTDDISEPGTKLELSDVPTATLEADQADDNQAGGSNANGGVGLGVLGQPSFKTNDAEGILFFTFADPYGQRPRVCFTPCPKNARCLATSRCTSGLRDGLTSGSGWFRLGFASQPAEPPDFGYKITPVVDPSGANAISGPGVVTGLSDTVRVNLPGPGNTNGTGGGSGAGGSGGGGTGAGGGGGASGCLTASTLNCTPAGSGGASSTCITAAEYSTATGGGTLPAACAPSGTTGCMNTNLALVKPCCPGLTCKVGSTCGGGSTFGGVCN